MFERICYVNARQRHQAVVAEVEICEVWEGVVERRKAPLGLSAGSGNH